MPNPGLIDTYLDDLLGALHLDAHRARRILIETEDHLLEAARSYLAGGAKPEQAERLAVERFGPVADLAARFNSSEPPPLSQKAWYFRLYLYAALLGAIGLVAVGLAGQISAGVGLAFGKGRIAGDPPGVIYTAARCAEYFKYEPQAATCEAAATDHHFDEIWRNTSAALILGILVLGSHLWLRRRYVTSADAATLPRRAFAILGAAAFGIAGLLLTPLGVLGIILQPYPANVSFLVDGVVALAFFAAFAPSGWRSLRALGQESNLLTAVPAVAE